MEEPSHGYDLAFFGQGLLRDRGLGDSKSGPLPTSESCKSALTGNNGVSIFWRWVGKA